MKKKMTDELYAKLVNEAEKATTKGHTYTRFEMLEVFDELGIELNGDTFSGVERLYADGFVKA